MSWYRFFFSHVSVIARYPWCIKMICVVSRVDIYQNTNQKQKSDEGVDCIIFFSANANSFYLKITEKNPWISTKYLWSGQVFLNCFECDKLLAIFDEYFKET